MHNKAFGNVLLLKSDFAIYLSSVKAIVDGGECVAIPNKSRRDTVYKSLLTVLILDIRFLVLLYLGI